MNSNGFKLRRGGEATEFQKRIDKIDTVILCMAEVERMIRNLGRELTTNIGDSPRANVRFRDYRRPAWEGIACSPSKTGR